MIDLISDVICPWCYVGFRALRIACESRDDVNVAITMRPFELDPSTPKLGTDYKARILSKFGGDTARLSEIRDSLNQAGTTLGISFNLDAITVSPNTRDCHRLLRWARGAGVELECAEALFRAYHVEGEDLSQASTLIAISRGIGMDGALIRQLLASTTDSDRVQNELDTAIAMGISAVPCAVFDQKFAVLGAQPVSAYITAIETAAQEASAR